MRRISNQRKLAGLKQAEEAAAAAGAEARSKKRKIQLEVLEMVQKINQPLDPIDAYGQFVSSSLQAMPDELRLSTQEYLLYLLQMSTPPNLPFELHSHIDQFRQRQMQRRAAAAQPPPPPPTPPQAPIYGRHHQQNFSYDQQGPEQAGHSTWPSTPTHFGRASNVPSEWTHELPFTPRGHSSTESEQQ
ncbi:hypothetical protein GDO78_023036 [Eleutherodactylus coqui]|uniref:Uncharacterized protein n=1 Tax=Eleutherodactylus coqui TaxID=57060 RepID=A0A8J6B3X6_ELECQ|nr:hypothetical protein GDO78_023036 [Eleutherodactylus coqui]